MKVPFSPPDITDAEIKEVEKVLRSGWITTGPETKLFEKQIAQYTKAERAVCLNSQTACAEMALRLLGVGAGDEVITTAYTYTATASVIAHVGAKIVLVDTKENSLEMDYDALERAITPNTKVIIPVDIAGIPCNYERIYQIVESKKNLFTPSSDMQSAFGRIVVSADCAHSFGAERGGVMAGNLADFSSFSFHAVKNLTTAEGGALTYRKIDGVDSDEIYRQVQLLSLHGQSKDALSKNKLGAWEYDIVAPYFKCNMTDIMAALGVAQLTRYDQMLARRREIVARYDQALRPLGVKTLDHYTAEHNSSGHLYLTHTPFITTEQRNEIITKMAEREIACNVHYKPLPLLSAYKNLGFDIKNYPNAYEFYQKEITLPLNTTLTDEQVDYVIENFVKIVKEYC